MPSDDPRIRLGLDALARPIAEFRSAIQGGLGHAQAALAAASANPATRTARARVDLGVFAEGRISPDAFAALAGPAVSPGAAALSALARAVGVLREVADRGEALFFAEVPSGGDLRAVVGAALAQAGRAFGAVTLAEAIRGGSYRPEAHDRLLEAVGFQAWNRAERRFAPPLVASVDGADLHATALSEFCDGRAKLVLVVRGACAPAALVRLITPGTLVLQTVDATGLDRVAGFDGPAVAALVPEAAARFLHDPAKGREPWQRLDVLALPEPPRHRLGGVSAWQMAEDLRQLASLARTPFAIPGPGHPGGGAALGSSEAVDRLAAWLLDRSESPAD